MVTAPPRRSEGGANALDGVGVDLMEPVAIGVAQRALTAIGLNSGWPSPISKY